MDKINKDLLNLLKQNARHSEQELSEMLGLSVHDISERLSSLESSGVIRQYTVIVNDNEISGVPIKALVELSISPQKGTGYDAIAKRIYGFSNVVSHYLVSGKYDFLVVVEGKDHKDIAHFVFDKLATLEHVTSTTTHFIFKSFKEQGVILDDVDSVSRLAILP